jgi:hypothetical protein
LRGYELSGGPVPLLAIFDVHFVVLDGSVALQVSLRLGGHEFEGAVDLIGADLSISVLIDLLDGLLSEGQGDVHIKADGLVQFRE